MSHEPNHPSTSLIAAFSEIAQHVHTSEDYEDSMRRLTEVAVQTIAGCVAASLSLFNRGEPVTQVATDQLARDGDQIQYEEGEGPCLDAAMHERWLSVPRMSADQRWPRSAARLADELGVGSMFSCRLSLDAAPHQTLGGMNLYATRVDAFTDEDQMMAVLLSSLGAVVIDGSRHQAHLRKAIESRQVIGEAIGILRAQSDLTSEEAFAMLSHASQRMNVRLRDLALQITERQGPGTATPPA